MAPLFCLAYKDPVLIEDTRIFKNMLEIEEFYLAATNYFQVSIDCFVFVFLFFASVDFGFFLSFKIWYLNLICCFSQMVQQEIRPNMRQIVTDWMLEVTRRSTLTSHSSLCLIG